MPETRKKNNFLALLIILVPVTIALLFYIRRDKEGALIDRGNRIAVAIDAYKDKNGKFPDSLGALGISKPDKMIFHYQKKDSARYILMFTASDGKPVTFDSDKHDWD